MTTDERLLAGWGKTSPSLAHFCLPHSVEELAAAFLEADGRGVIARGLGRSYGDAAQNAGGTVLSTLNLNKIRSFDRSTGDVTVDGGLSLDALIKTLIPMGRFPTVTPGTRHVTVGGAIAADIHGKNHHRDGSFCDHLISLKLLTPAGDQLEVSAQSEPDLFAATAGGMGLTGVVVEATLRTTAIETKYVWVDTERADNLEEALLMMSSGDHNYRYSAAWIDCFSRGRNLGRSILTRGDHARLEDLPPVKHASAISLTPRPIKVPIDAPTWLINRNVIRLFNQLWFHKTPKRQRTLESAFSFLYPLDGLSNWNRLYGRLGFLQYQFVVPFGQESVLTTVVEEFSKARFVSLGVLKSFGLQRHDLLSFPMQGWTLAVDIPTRFDGISEMLDRFDQLIAEANGRVYLAKDSRLRPELLRQFYPRLEHWKEIQSSLDPAGRMQSDLARRIRLT